MLNIAISVDRSIVGPIKIFLNKTKYKNCHVTEMEQTIEWLQERRKITYLINAQLRQVVSISEKQSICYGTT